MLVTNHVLAGAALGAALPGPGTALAAGVVSHFAMDVVPHWGDYLLEEMIHVAICDGLVGLTAMSALTLTSPPGRRAAVLAGMVGAALPDLDKPSTYFFGRSCFPGWLDRWHGRIQRESRTRMPQEFVVGGILLVAAVAIARRPVGRGAAPSRPAP